MSAADDMSAPAPRTAPAVTGSATERPTSRRAGSARGARRLADGLTYLFLLAGALIVLGPFLLAVMTSLKSASQFRTSSPLSLPDPVTFENFTALFGDRYDFVVPLAVTAQVVLVLVVTQMISSVLAAYAFAVLDFPGRDALFWVYVSCLMIPAVVTIIPLYSMVAALGWRNTFEGLVVPFLFAGPYAIFLLRENFKMVPQEILDAATLDGAGPVRTLTRIMLPMNVPILTTLLLVTVVSQWNNFLWPLIAAPNPEWHVMTVATVSLQTQYEGNWTLVMAASVVALAPLIALFLVFQRRITAAIGVTGVR